MKNVLLLLISFYTSCCFGQSIIDSLRRNLKTIDNDSVIARTYRGIGIEYMRINLDSALAYFEKSEELCKKNYLEHDFAVSIYRKATVYRAMNRYEIAKDDLLIAWDTFDDLEFNLGLSIVKIELAHIAANQNHLNEAVSLFLEAIPLAKLANDEIAESRVYNHLGTIFMDQEQFDKAIEYYERALLIADKLNFELGISSYKNNIGSVYSQLKQYDKALLYLNEALEIKMKLGDKKGASKTLDQLGRIYLIQENQAAAETTFLRSYDLAKEVGDNRPLVYAQFGLAEIAYQRKEYNTSIALLDTIQVTLETTEDLQLARDVHKLLINAYYGLGNLEKVLEHSNKVNTLSDSLYHNTILSVTNDLEAKYQNEQKAQEIALLATERDLQGVQLQKRVNERNGIIAFALVSALIAGLLYNQYRLKQQTNKELRELDRVKSDFFANISHEFRTPLTLIKGPIEQLEQQPDKPIEIDTVRMIRRNTNKLLQLVNQLLDLSRIDKGNLQLNPTEGDIYKCLRVAASSFNSQAAHRHIDYKVNIPNKALWASLDRDKLEAIIYNLLGNAFKFSEDESAISIDALYNGQELQLAIKDSGKGIPEEKLPFIFDRFYQVDSSLTREKAGSGIGLALTKELIALMDGTITVKSKIGQGSTFRIHIPLLEIKTGTGQYHPPRLIEDHGQVPQPDPIENEDQRPVETILIVEDNRDMRQFIKSQLIHSYKVLEAKNGMEGKEKAGSLSPGLIITDLMMPKLDGMELCHSLKTDINTSHIPVIMLTAKAGIDNKIKGLETGADDYLVKPFNARELQVRVRNLILQRKMLREHYSLHTYQIDPKAITANSLDEKFVNQLLGRLENQYSDPAFGAADLQKTLGMSRMQLHRKLKALTNEAPGELIRNFRLKRAEQLLSQKADTVTQIAYRVGFNNISYFAKCFREKFGVAPSQYKV